MTTLQTKGNGNLGESNSMELQLKPKFYHNDTLFVSMVISVILAV
jgi:hypothetical protein